MSDWLNLQFFFLKLFDEIFNIFFFFFCDWSAKFIISIDWLKKFTISFATIWWKCQFFFLSNWQNLWFHSARNWWNSQFFLEKFDKILNFLLAIEWRNLWLFFQMFGKIYNFFLDQLMKFEIFFCNRTTKFPPPFFPFRKCLTKF